MAGIGKINNMLARLRQKSIASNAKKGSRSASRSQSASSNTQPQIELAQKLRTLDLDSPLGRRRARYIFVEHALTLEFGEDLSQLPAIDVLVRKIERQFSADAKLCGELDSLIKELQQSN